MEEERLGAMIPLSDASRRPLHFPIITILIILANVVVFWYELQGGDAFVLTWAAIPANVIAGHAWTTILTSMFMHGGWLHILGNMVFLWAFGPQIEDAMGPFKYLIFYLLGGLVAMLAQVLASPSSTIPTLGASGAIAAVMGAFLITFPTHRIRTVLIIFIFISVRLIPAAVLIGFWLLMQFFNVGKVATAQAGGVAYLAHIGGALFGVVAARLFEDPARIASA